MSEHSKLPWKMSLTEGLIVADDGHIVADPPAPHSRFQPGDQWANHDRPLIIRRVNSHAALVEAAEDTVAWLKAWESDGEMRSARLRLGLEAALALAKETE